MQQRANGQKNELGEGYAVRWSEWTRPRDPLVTDDTPTTNAAEVRSGQKGAAATAQGRAHGEREEDGVLTAIPQVCKGELEGVRRRRIGPAITGGSEVEASP
jgi:hypothetical protein